MASPFPPFLMDIFGMNSQAVPQVAPNPQPVPPEQNPATPLMDMLANNSPAGGYNPQPPPPNQGAAPTPAPPPNQGAAPQPAPPPNQNFLPNNQPPQNPFPNSPTGPTNVPKPTPTQPQDGNVSRATTGGGGNVSRTPGQPAPQGGPRWRLEQQQRQQQRRPGLPNQGGPGPVRTF